MEIHREVKRSVYIFFFVFFLLFSFFVHCNSIRPFAVSLLFSPPLLPFCSLFEPKVSRRSIGWRCLIHKFSLSLGRSVCWDDTLPLCINGFIECQERVTGVRNRKTRWGGGRGGSVGASLKEGRRGAVSELLIVACSRHARHIRTANSHRPLSLSLFHTQPGASSTNWI